MMMLPQRACAAENRVKNKSSNGPLRVQSKELLIRVFCNVRHASAAGDIISILPRVWLLP